MQHLLWEFNIYIHNDTRDMEYCLNKVYKAETYAVAKNFLSEDLATMKLEEQEFQIYEITAQDFYMQ